MNLIKIFEEMPFQNVKSFNQVFKTTPIVGFDSDEDVRIGEMTIGNERRVYVGDSVLSMDLTQKKSIRVKKKVVEKPVKKLEMVEKTSREIPSVYKILKPTEFMIYSAIKEVGQVDGIQELSRKISISNKTILANLKRLTDLGLVTSKRVTGKEGSFNKLTVDTSVK